MILNGLFVPIITPLEKNSCRPDLARLTTHLDYLLTTGVAGIIANGTTGDFHMLSAADRAEIAATVIARVKSKTSGKVPKVLIGTSALTTTDSMTASRHAEKIGADGVMIAAPFYTPLARTALYTHFANVAASMSLPILIYDNPVCTGQYLGPDLIQQLAGIDNIVAVKESAGETTVDAIQAIRSRTDDSFAILCGEDNMVLPALAAGVSGMVLGFANAIPDKFLAIYEAYMSNDLATARSRYYALFPLWQFIANWREVSYGATIKSVIHMRGLGDYRVCKAPDEVLTPEQETQLEEIIRACDII